MYKCFLHDISFLQRVCIRPEVCRTKTFGYKGVSKGEFSPFLRLIKLNDQPVDFSKIDLNYLKKVSLCIYTVQLA